METEGQIVDGFRPLRGVTGLACLWQLALPSHLKCWCFRVEWNSSPRGRATTLHFPTVPQAGPCCWGSPGVPAHNQTSPGRRVLHVTNGSPKHSASPSSQPGQEPRPVWGLTGLRLYLPAHACATHATSTIPPKPIYKPPSRKLSSAPLFHKLESNRAVSGCHGSPKFFWFMAHMADIIATWSAGCHKLYYKKALLWLNYVPEGCMIDNFPSIIIRAATNRREKEQNTASSSGIVGKNSSWIKGLDGEDYWLGFKLLIDYLVE